MTKKFEGPPAPEMPEEAEKKELEKKLQEEKINISDYAKEMMGLMNLRIPTEEERQEVLVEKWVEEQIEKSEAKKLGLSVEALRERKLREKIQEEIEKERRRREEALREGFVKRGRK